MFLSLLIDLAQYYNLAVIKDAKERSHVFPVTTTKPVNSPPLLRRDIDNCINQRSFLNQSNVPRDDILITKILRYTFDYRS